MQHANKSGAIDHPKLMCLARNPVMLSVVTRKPLGKCFKTPLVSGMEDISQGANQADGQNSRAVKTRHVHATCLAVIQQLMTLRVH